MIWPGDAVAVVGGGLLGSTTALRLAEAGARVTVLEAAPSLGGLAAAWAVPVGDGEITWDRYYHVTLESDAALRGLLRDLGLDADIAWTSTSTGYFAGGRLVPVSTPRDFLQLPGLSLVAKARLATTLARALTVRDWRALERMPADRWLTRWSGRATFEGFWVPLLEAKLGDGWRDANAAFIWATVQRLTAARRAGIGDERFGAVRGGYARILAVLADRLAALGVVVETGRRVERVRERSGRVTVDHDSGAASFDHCVLTTTPRVAARLVDGLSAANRACYEAVSYQGVVCASVVLARPLAPYYLTYLMDPLPFTAIVEMTALIPPAWVGGHTLVYLPRYCAADDPWFARSDDEIVEEFLRGLATVHPVGADDVLATRVARTAEVFPRPTIGYSERVPGVDTGVPGVSLVSSAQIVNGTLNANETIGRAERAVADLVGAAGAGP